MRRLLCASVPLCLCVSDAVGTRVQLINDQLTPIPHTCRFGLISEGMVMRSLKTVIFASLLLLNLSLTFAAGRSDVADAVMRGDKAALRMLLQKKADVNAAQTDGATAMHWAVYRDDLESVDLLIQSGSKVDIKNREGVTPLHMASLYGNARIIGRLLKAGADAKQKGPAGETLLMLAARNGNPEAITMLVAAGADVNAKEPIRGTTALMWAVEQRHSAAVAALIDAKADVSAKSAGAGVPRNYMAGRVNPARVEAAVRVRAEAAKAGRTYEEQLEFEQKNGTLQVRRIGDATSFFGQQQAGQQAGAQRGGQQPAQQAAQPAAQQDDDSEFIF